MNEVQKTTARITLERAVEMAQLAYDGARAVGSSDKTARKSELRTAKMALRVFDKLSAVNG